MNDPSFGEFNFGAQCQAHIYCNRFYFAKCMMICQICQDFLPPKLSTMWYFQLLPKVHMHGSLQEVPGGHSL